MREIERIHGKPWYEALIESIDFRQGSGFSEYEMLGTFFVARNQATIGFQDGQWTRRGASKVGLGFRLNMSRISKLFPDFDFVSFEKCDKKVGLMRSLGVKLHAKFSRFKSRLLRAKGRDFLRFFLSQVFGNTKNLCVLQVGANDGVQNDFLREWIKSPGAFTARLVEPIDEYAES